MRNNCVILSLFYLHCLFTSALPANCEYVVNFAPQLAEIIAETKYLEKLGFKVRCFTAVEPPNKGHINWDKPFCPLYIGD